MKGRRCLYCRQAFQPNRYHPQQKVCNQPACQSQRRSDYHRQKIDSDPIYQQTCLQSPRKWREAHPDYWRKYRREHPGLVERNRRQQHLRDEKRRLANLANNTLASCQVPCFQSGKQTQNLGSSRSVPPDQVREILRMGSPDFPRDHGDPEDYLRRTLSRAFAPRSPKSDH